LSPPESEGRVSLELLKNHLDISRVPLQDVLDALPFYVMLIDPDHYILAANQAVQSQLGVKPRDILGKYCPQIIHGLNQPFEGCPLEEAVKTGKATVSELWDKASGRWSTSAVYPTRAVTPQGKTIYLHIVVDITDRKKAEAALRVSRDQLHKLSSYLERAMEAEKKKIARDLHDETSQLIASLHAFLQAASETLEQDPAKTLSLLKKAQSVTKTIHDEIHRLIYELRPSMLDELGLIAAVQSLQTSVLGAAGLKSELKISGQQRRLGPDQETALFRVVQESFSNIVRHSQARRVKVKIFFRKAFARLCVSDDGVGFDFSDAISSKEKVRGVGLIGMRERIDLIGGKLEISARPGEGTEVVVEVPYLEEADRG
jgi:PAS domain S-box-containing protein